MHAAKVFRVVRSLDSALDALADQAAALGFDAIDYGYMPRARRYDGRWNAPDIVSRKFPPRWERGWTRFASYDPFLCSCYERNLPLDWTEVKSAGWLSSIQREAITFIEELGFLDGITVPIHLSDGRFAFVSGLCHAPYGAWRTRVQSTEELFVLAHAFHSGVARHVGIPGPARVIILTPREREVLMHAAAGRGAPATALAMHRALETVRRQRKSAMSKLGAQTITQAVACAIAQGLV